MANNAARLERMFQYIEGVMDESIVAGKYVKLAYERFLNDLERQETDESFDWVFDINVAAKYIAFIETVCVHTRGKWAGKPFILSPWQVAFCGQLFGWVHKNDKKRRRFNTAHFFVARKSGKSQLASAIILAMAVLDDDGAPQFVTAATKRDQAKEVFDEVRRCIKKSPELSKRFVVHKNEIYGPKEGVIKPISSDANTLDGLSLNIGCVDEMHAMKDGDLYRVLASSMGSRKSPLMLAISTAGFVTDGLATQFVKGGKSVLDGQVQNDNLLFMIYEIDKEDGDLWDDPEAWKKANPGLGTSIELDYLMRQYENAKLYGGRHITEFMVKHCNIFVGSEQVWIDDDVWMSEENLSMPISLDVENKIEAYAGLDLSATEDITAISVVFGNQETGIQVDMYYFLPQSAIDRRLEKDENSIYTKMHELHNVYISPGNTVDYNTIRRKISGNYFLDGKLLYDEDNLCKKYNLKGIAYDRWNSLSLIRDLTGDGVVCDPYGQGFASLSFPSKSLERMALEGKLFHGGDELLRWMMSNVTLQVDAAGNIKPDKGKSGDKIDGVVALVMAIGEMLTFEEEEKKPEFKFFMDFVSIK